jgi:hypothetical protein
MSSANHFRDIIKTNSIIPLDMINHLRQNAYLPLSFFSSKDLTEHRLSNKEYLTTSTIHGGKKVILIDIRAPTEAEFKLSKADWLDCYRNAYTAYEKAFGKDVADNLRFYVERLRDQPAFKRDSDWPVVLAFDINVRSSWFARKEDGGKFFFCQDSTFEGLDIFLRDLDNKRREEDTARNKALMEALEKSKFVRRNDDHERGNHHNPKEPDYDRGTATAESSGQHTWFWRGGSGGGPSRCCVLCGDPNHPAWDCRVKATALCSYQKKILRDIETRQPICFRFNIGAPCDDAGSSNHAPHKCSVCLHPGHSAQEHHRRH